MTEDETMTAWFWWSSWAPERLEEWLEAQAAKGWQVVKADRWLLRFHFQRSSPRTIRVCADFPADSSSDYRLLFEDAGWELLSNQPGWYLWQMEYSGARPEAFTDVDSLIGRNARLLAIFLAGFVGMGYVLLTSRTVWQMESGVRVALWVLALVLLLALLLMLGATAATIFKLRERRTIKSD